MILTDGIVLVEMLERKWRIHVFPSFDVAQNCRVGWMAVVLQWQMVLSDAKFVSVTKTIVANTQQVSQSVTVEDSMSTTLGSPQFVTYVIKGNGTPDKPRKNLIFPYNQRCQLFSTYPSLSHQPLPASQFVTPKPRILGDLFLGPSSSPFTPQTR